MNIQFRNLLLIFWLGSATITLSACGGGAGGANNGGIDPTVGNCQDVSLTNPVDENGVTITYNCKSDSDKDGIKNDVDNCPADYNINQTDTDLDGQGNACDADDDNDGLEDTADNCPAIANMDQADMDADAKGDLCDLDNDNDGIDDSLDICPLVADESQSDLDGDGIGDACDPDADNDGFEDTADNCPLVAQTDQADIDGDGIGDACDSANFVEVCPYKGIPFIDPSLANKCYLLPVSPPPPPTYCPGDAEIAQNALPPTTNTSRGKVTARQLEARILAKAAGIPDMASLNALVQDTFNAARRANNKTESWNNCDAQARWTFDALDYDSGVLRYPSVTGLFTASGAGARVYRNEEMVIVAFEGTGASLNDILLDLHDSPVAFKGVRFHSGVLNHWLRHKRYGVWKEISDGNPNSTTAPKTVYFTGHSLGAATATIALYDYVKTIGLSSRKFPLVFTFGSPPTVDKGNYCVSTGRILPPWWSCTDNPTKYDLTTAYGFRTNTHLKNLIFNFANTHTDNVKYDPVPHLFRSFSHVGYHTTLQRNGDTLTGLTAGSLTSRWRFRSINDGFDVKRTVGLLAPVIWGTYEPYGEIPQHNTCFYARSLEYAVDGSQERWLNDSVYPSATITKTSFNQCVYQN